VAKEEQSLFRPIEVKPLPGYRLWVRYSDGVQGEVDLSHLAGRGVFALWNQPGTFEAVYIGSSGAIAWSDTIDICPDSIYLRIVHKAPQDVFPNMVTAEPYA
jgi:hypothetical protein